MTFIDHAPDRPGGGYGMLAALLAATLAVGAIGGWATAGEIPGWYAGLAKPGFNPPNGVFAPVWTALYILMAVAAWRVGRIAGATSRPLLLFYVQLALNLAWSFIFFRAHALGWALVEIGILLAAIVATAWAFARRDRVAGLLLVPYIAWVCFASVLNAAVWRLN